MTEELIKEFKKLAEQLQRSHGYTPHQLERLLHPETVVPAGVFATGHSPLQAIVTYLHDALHHSFTDIAAELHRSYRAVWGAYVKEGVVVAETAYTVPISAICEELSILESVVLYLRKEGCRFTEIARTLHKDPRTIWTVNKRAEVKRARASSS